MDNGIITKEVADRALTKLEVDNIGLDEIDHKVLQTIIDKFNGGPVGLETIAASISEESDTIMDVYEPYLLQLGFLDRTPRGRVATERAYQHLGLPYKKNPSQPTLWQLRFGRYNLPCLVRPMAKKDIPQVANIDREAFPTMWPPVNFHHELTNRLAHYVVACDGSQGNRRTATQTTCRSADQCGPFWDSNGRLVPKQQPVS